MVPKIMLEGGHAWVHERPIAAAHAADAEMLSQPQSGFLSAFWRLLSESLSGCFRREPAAKANSKGKGQAVDCCES